MNQYLTKALYLTVNGDVECCKLFAGDYAMSGPEVAIKSVICQGQELKVGDKIHYRKRKGFPSVEIVFGEWGGGTEAVITDIKFIDEVATYIYADKI